MDIEPPQLEQRAKRMVRLSRTEWWFCWTLLFPIPIASSIFILLSWTSLKMAFPYSTSGTVGMFATCYGVLIAIPVFIYVLLKRDGKLVLWGIAGWIVPFVFGWMVSPSIAMKSDWKSHYNRHRAEFIDAALWLDQQQPDLPLGSSRIPQSIQQMARDVEAFVANDLEHKQYLVIPIVHVWIDDGIAFIYSKSKLRPPVGICEQILKWQDLGDGWWLVKYT